VFPPPRPASSPGAHHADEGAGCYRRVQLETIVTKQLALEEDLEEGKKAHAATYSSTLDEMGAVRKHMDKSMKGNRPLAGGDQ
jgi:hypothetical protein